MVKLIFQSCLSAWRKYVLAYSPPLKFISNFDEINVRTYVEHDNKKGVYFLNIETGNALSAKLAKALSGLPYEKSDIMRKENAYYSFLRNKNFHLKIEYTIGEKISQKSELDIWLTERYCLYLEDKGYMYRYDIHHLECELYNLSIQYADISYKLPDLMPLTTPAIVHYSPGVQVIAWGKELIK